MGVPPLVWIWVAAAVAVTAVLAFVAGMRYERGASRRALRRARKHLSRLVEVVFESLDSAHEACRSLQQFPHASLTPRQLEALRGQQRRLEETVGDILEEQKRRAESAAMRRLGVDPSLGDNGSSTAVVCDGGGGSIGAVPAEYTVSWQRDRTDDRSGLPDRICFDANLGAMLEAGSKAPGFGGLLLIKIDRFDQLRQRHGGREADGFLRKLAGAVLRSARDEDLLCRFADDTLALLMPSLSPETGRTLSHRIRQSVRNSHFRLNENGSEVLVTASFGYAASYPGDTAEHVLSRAGNALEKSQRRGRNQLHVHDGDTVVHCLAG